MSVFFVDKLGIEVGKERREKKCTNSLIPCSGLLLSSSHFLCTIL